MKKSALKKSKKKKNSTSKPVACIQVVGKNRLQNELLLSFVEEKINIDILCAQDLESTSLIHKNTSGHGPIQFLLVDYNEFSVENLWDVIDSLKSSMPGQSCVALFNVDPQMKIEKRAMRSKIQGIFYNNDPPGVITKGVAAILNGDLWFSRKELVKEILEQNRSMNSLNHVTNSNLTIREREILSLIALGFTNKKIANELFISSHTVKTHVYNIYKKISVNNRFQAILWGIKNL